MSRKLFSVSCLLSIAAFLAAAVSLSAARVPALEGSSVRLDFGRPYIEEWMAAPPADFQSVSLPRQEGIDWEGIHDPVAWDRAAVLGPLVSGEPRTEFFAFFSSRGLFFRADNYFPPQSPPEARERERNKPSWNEDMIEIRLRVPDDGPARRNPVYHFVMTAAGTVYDSRDGRAEYDARWESRAEVGEGVWHAWFLIPFEAIEEPGAVPELEINIGRNGPGFPALSWGPFWTGTAERRLILPGASARPSAVEEISLPAATGPAVTMGVRTGRGISLSWVSGEARAQDRWIEGTVELESGVFQPGDRVEVRLLRPGGDEPVEVVAISPERRTGLVFVDLRRWGLDSAEVEARLLRGGETLGLAKSFLTASPLPAPPRPGFRVALRSNVPEGPAVPGPWPLTAGVPFPVGMLWDLDGWVVEDAAGTLAPAQFEVTGRWAHEGPVRWLRVDTLASPGAELYLAYRPGTQPPAPADPVEAVADGERLVISNGLSAYRLSAGHSPVREISVGGRLLASAEGARGLYLVDQRGRLAAASAEGAEVRLEAAGPVVACVRIEGDYRVVSGPEAGEAVARHITRVELFAGLPFARVVHTLVLSRDTNEVWFREAGWEMEVSPGADPEAIFGVSRRDPLAFERLPAAGAETWLLQESYFRFGEGEKVFRLGRGEETLRVGEEMGDWFLLQGAGGGLMVSCRESARQHPKEFSVSGSRMNLKLFSARAGEELDFRSPALAEKWNLRNWVLGRGIPPYILQGRGDQEERADIIFETVRNMPSNALGWAKTHELVFSPAAAPRAPEEPAALSWRHSRPVFMSADPWWIYESRAMGPLHPRDPERFPEAERLVEAALAGYASQSERFGLWGFVDYRSGPTFLFEDGRRYPKPRRWNFPYTVRTDAWRVFARSGSREAWEFATATNRTWGDNHMISWGGPGKIKGLVARTGPPDSWTGSMAYPFYWGGTGTMNYTSGATSIYQFAWDYHLTGWRRAGDIMNDYAAGVLESWRPQLRDRGVYHAFLPLVHCYDATLDRRFRELAYDAFSHFSDEESALGLDKNRTDYGTSYKAGVHFREFLKAWQVFGDRRFYRQVMRFGDYTWKSAFGSSPPGYVSPVGYLGSFLYDETGNPAIAQELLLSLRRAGTMLGQVGEHGLALGTHQGTFFFEGIPAIQDVIRRSGADRAPAASWAAARDFDDPVAFFLDKKPDETLRFSLRSPHPGASALGGPRIRMVDPGGALGTELMTASLLANDYSAWTVPVDAPGGAVRVEPAALADHHLVARGTPGLVVHATGYWVPMPAQEPPVPWYFRVPEDSRNPALFLEGRARVYTPAGEPWRETDGVPGWLELPPELPGLWSFVPLEQRLVRVRNLPPFFAAGNPESWFDPGVAWEPEPERELPATPEASGFVDGLPGERGLYIRPRNSRFFFDGGEELPGDAGREFLPAREGTIEFWLKPLDWGTFNMPSDPREGRVQQTLLRTDGGPRLFYIMDYANPTAYNLHMLMTGLDIVNEVGYGWTMANYRGSTVFEPGEWVHIAVTWGPRERARILEGRVRGMTLVTFVNGRARAEGRAFPIGYLPSRVPTRLNLPETGGVVSHLRVSDIIRYEADFTPRPGAPAVDGHTRAYFSFDGTLEGVSGDGTVIEGNLVP